MVGLILRSYLGYGVRVYVCLRGTEDVEAVQHAALERGAVGRAEDLRDDPVEALVLPAGVKPRVPHPKHPVGEVCGRSRQGYVYVFVAVCCSAHQREVLSVMWTHRWCFIWVGIPAASARAKYRATFAQASYSGGAVRVCAW